MLVGSAAHNFRDVGVHTIAIEQFAHQRIIPCRDRLIGIAHNAVARAIGHTNRTLTTRVPSVGLQTLMGRFILGHR